VVDYDEVRSGRARTGFIFSLVTMTNQIGSAVGVWLAFQLLDVIGFSPGATEHDPETLTQFRWIYVGVPATLSLIVAALMLHFPIDRASQRNLRRRIEARTLNVSGAPRID
jgi:Na+/melibiose symporter-like transporter